MSRPWSSGSPPQLSRGCRDPGWLDGRPSRREGEPEPPGGAASRAPRFPAHREWSRVHSPRQLQVNEERLTSGASAARQQHLGWNARRPAAFKIPGNTWATPSRTHARCAARVGCGKRRHARIYEGRARGDRTLAPASSADDVRPLPWTSGAALIALALLTVVIIGETYSPTSSACSYCASDAP